MRELKLTCTYVRIYLITSSHDVHMKSRSIDRSVELRLFVSPQLYLCYEGDTITIDRRLYSAVLSHSSFRRRPPQLRVHAK